MHFFQDDSKILKLEFKYIATVRNVRMWSSQWQKWVFMQIRNLIINLLKNGDQI